MISVLIEGYNDSLDLGSALETMNSVARQAYPLQQVEIILTGSEKQAAKWREALREERRFFALKVIAADAHYYRLKNLAAEAAGGEILAFTDSDVLVEPGWLEAIARGIENGADVVAGVTLFRPENASVSFAGLLTAAASVSWGFVAGDAARGFLSHNVGFRRSAFERIRYREDLGRTCAGSFLYDAARGAGLAIRFQSGQRVRHVFTWRWWLTRLHVRFGYEVFLLRRLNPSARHAWIQRLSLVEPLATMAWHMALDIPQWFRFSRQLGWSWSRRIAYLPCVCAVSIPARSAEAFGMYSTIFDEERMRRFALSN
ncbi:MAG TPA: glycosyltransferase [Bryobacteraceae bacterium]|nr:glycosyltransferase [Bryobacteraceae bacterium]